MPLLSSSVNWEVLFLQEELEGTHPHRASSALLPCLEEKHLLGKRRD